MELKGAKDGPECRVDGYMTRDRVRTVGRPAIARKNAISADLQISSLALFEAGFQPVIPAQAGIQELRPPDLRSAAGGTPAFPNTWIPAFAGMTMVGGTSVFPGNAPAGKHR